MFKSQGIALLQVLFLSLIISAMLLGARFQGEKHLRLAEMVQSRTIAELKIQSASAKTILSLLSHQRRIDPNSAEQIYREWNFYGAPWLLGDVEVRLQDLAGLLQPTNTELAGHLFVQLGIDEVSADRLKQLLQRTTITGASPDFYHLADIQVKRSTGRIAPLQLIEEMRLYPQMEQLNPSKLQDFFTTFPVATINPMTMPEQLLSFYVPGNLQREQLLKLRSEGSLSEQKFSQLTGIFPDETINFYPADGIRFIFTASDKDVRIQRQVELRLTPYAVEPYTLWEYRN